MTTFLKIHTMNNTTLNKRSDPYWSDSNDLANINYRYNIHPIGCWTKNRVFLPPNHPFYWGFSMIFTIHLGGPKNPLCLVQHPVMSPQRQWVVVTSWGWKTKVRESLGGRVVTLNGGFCIRVPFPKIPLYNSGLGIIRKFALRGWHFLPSFFFGIMDWGLVSPWNEHFRP